MLTIEELIDELKELILNSEKEGEDIADLANHIINFCGGSSFVVYEGDSSYSLE